MFSLNKEDEKLLERYNVSNKTNAIVVNLESYKEDLIRKEVLMNLKNVLVNEGYKVVEEGGNSYVALTKTNKFIILMSAIFKDDFIERGEYLTISLAEYKNHNLSYYISKCEEFVSK